MLIMKPLSSCQKQQGATLIVGLIMLFLLTIIGMASMNITTVDVKVTANAKDRQLAFIGAESAMFEAGQIILNSPEENIYNATPSYVGKQFQATGVNWWSNENNWNLTAVPGTTIESQFQIEFPIPVPDDIDLGTSNLGTGKFSGLFPTTVTATGPGQANVVLQSYYRKKLDSNPL